MGKKTSALVLLHARIHNFFPGWGGGGGPCVSLQFAVRVDVRLLFVILLCEAESEIKRQKEGSNSLSDSYKLLNHLEKKGVVPDPPLKKETQNGHSDELQLGSAQIYIYNFQLLRNMKYFKKKNIFETFYFAHLFCGGTECHLYARNKYV